VGLLIDSSVLIDAERGRLDLGARLAPRVDEAVSISAVTASELLHGVHRASTPRQRVRRERFVEWVLRQLSVAPFRLSEARVHALLWADLEARGIRLGAHDLLIGATAVSLGFSLATANLREFTRIPDLRIEDWSTKPA
jgi:tRNA(fMet)-specific endonuclease VapC